MIRSAGSLMQEPDRAEGSQSLRPRSPHFNDSTIACGAGNIEASFYLFFPSQEFFWKLLLAFVPWGFFPLNVKLISAFCLLYGVLSYLLGTFFFFFVGHWLHINSEEYFGSEIWSISEPIPISKARDFVRWLESTVAPLVHFIRHAQVLKPSPFTEYTEEEKDETNSNNHNRPTTTSESKTTTCTTQNSPPSATANAANSGKTSPGTSPSTCSSAPHCAEPSTLP